MSNKDEKDDEITTNKNVKEDIILPGDVTPFGWLARPCLNYWEEHVHCKSFHGRFYQYYIDGKLTDCSHWKRKGKLCDKWEESRDKEALEALVEEEKARYSERLAPNLANDVWQRRKEPPENWGRPLPEEHMQRIQQSRLKKLIEHGSDAGSCVIL